MSLQLLVLNVYSLLPHFSVERNAGEECEMVVTMNGNSKSQPTVSFAALSHKNGQNRVNKMQGSHFLVPSSREMMAK